MTEFGQGKSTGKRTITVVRLTHWPHPDMPTTMATTEHDLKVTPIEMVEQMLKAHGGFFTYEVFEAVNDDIAAAGIEAAKRAEAAYDDERNMAIAYLWYIQRLPLLKDDGMMMGTEPAPLSREQMAWVLRSVSLHSSYGRQQFRVPLADGTTIEMKDGEVMPA